MFPCPAWKLYNFIQEESTGFCHGEKCEHEKKNIRQTQSGNNSLRVTLSRVEVAILFSHQFFLIMWRKKNNKNSSSQRHSSHKVLAVTFRSHRSKSSVSHCKYLLFIHFMHPTVGSCTCLNTIHFPVHSDNVWHFIHANTAQYNLNSITKFQVRISPEGSGNRREFEKRRWSRENAAIGIQKRG